MITIIDYGVGNIGSIRNMLRKIGVDHNVSSDPDKIAAATKLVLPGVGAFDVGMQALNDTGVGVAVRAAADGGATTLGICLGMQLLTQGSAEGKLPGLGVIAGHCARFDVRDHGLKMPHMGWNVVTPQAGARLFDHTGDELRYYFVHSYKVVCDDENDIAGTTDYGGAFTCAFQRANVYGAQFHPEKSHRFGQNLFAKFVEL